MKNVIILISEVTKFWFISEIVATVVGIFKTVQIDRNILINAL